jgi:hypothetical protein
MSEARSPKWESAARYLRTEEAQREAWQRQGRPDVLWTGEAASQRIEVVESDAHSTGKRRKRRVTLAASGFPELTAHQAQELSKALAEAARQARTARRASGS